MCASVLCCIQCLFQEAETAKPPTDLLVLHSSILPNRKRHTASSPLTLLSISFISVFTKILREHYRGLCHFVCSYLCDSHETTQGTGIIPASLASPEPSHQLLMCAWKLVCVWGSAGTHRLDQLFKKMRGFANMPRQYLCGHSCIQMYMIVGS